MIQGLPCLDCTIELQAIAVSNSGLLAELAVRIERGREAIADARQRNKRFISANDLDPFLRYYFTPSPGQPNPLQRLFDDFPLGLIGNAVSAIGIPFVGNLLMGNPERDRNRIEIEALEVQIDELERNAKEAQNELKQAIARQVSKIDSQVILFQSQRELMKNDAIALEIAAIEYRNGIDNGFPQKRQAYQRQQTEVLQKWGELGEAIAELKILIGLDIY